MEQRPLAERVAAVATLDDPARRALFDHVVESGGSVSREAAATALGLPRSTAAFHLDRLAAEGLLAVEYRRLGGRTGPGAGRPSKLYREPDQEIAVSIPERHYDLAAELLAAAVDESTRTSRPVADVLPTTAGDIGREIGAAAESLWLALDSYGFKPRTDEDSGWWVLGNCPFHRLARRYTDLVCGANLELLRGVAAGAGDDKRALILDPAPGRCCVRVASELAGANG